MTAKRLLKQGFEKKMRTGKILQSNAQNACENSPRSPPVFAPQYLGLSNALTLRQQRLRFALSFRLRPVLSRDVLVLQKYVLRGNLRLGMNRR